MSLIWLNGMNKRQKRRIIVLVLRMRKIHFLQENKQRRFRFKTWSEEVGCQNIRFVRWGRSNSKLTFSGLPLVHTSINMGGKLVQRMVGRFIIERDELLHAGQGSREFKVTNLRLGSEDCLRNLRRDKGHIDETEANESRKSD